MPDDNLHSEFGVTVAICCYNSAARLPRTLAALRQQHVAADVKWEVLIVDNNSTDDTAEAARRSWAGCTATLRVVPEPVPGLSAARRRALAEARYEIVSFVDDDNWVSPDWVQLTARIMAAHPDIGACNGVSEPVCEISAPAWFERFKGGYAVTIDHWPDGDVTWEPQLLFGAGMTVRKQAWRGLIDDGFRFLTSGRKGKSLSAGEDIELCLALRMAGWRLWRDRRLRFSHFIPRTRLTWDYCRRLYRGWGSAVIFIDVYQRCGLPSGSGRLARLRATWQWQAFYVVQNLLAHPVHLVATMWRNRPGDPDVIRYDTLIGRLRGFVRARGRFESAVLELRAAPWVRVTSRPAGLAEEAAR